MKRRNAIILTIMIGDRYCLADFPFSKIGEWEEEPRRRGNQGTRRPLDYLHNLSAFDIETTRDPETEQAWMYVWMWGFEGIGVLLGRTWAEFKDAMEKVREQLNGRTLVVLVHNLSYEFSYLRMVHEWSPEEVFALQPRKVAKARIGDDFEFRCTYIHSNMSLDLWTRKMGVEHAKKDGAEFNYLKTRYADTPLSDFELEYCCNDVLGCMEAYRAEMDRDGDLISTIPMTSTGYVRRDVKHAMKPMYKMLHNMAPTYRTYVALREAFRGGLTHANRYYAGVILHDVHSADRSSSYPDVICNCDFPMGKFRAVRSCTAEKVRQLLHDRKAVLCRILMWGVRLRDDMDGFPYLSVSKCRGMRAYNRQTGERATYAEDNGRVLRADFLETTVTDVDLRIILRQYQCDDLQIHEAWWTHYGPLPDPLRLTVCDYYRNKTELKGKEDRDSRLLYDKSKNLLNSCYGMMAQDPLRDSIAWIAGAWQLAFLDKSTGQWTIGQRDPEKVLQEAQRNIYLLYQWGCWVTAWARLRLMEGVEQCRGRCVYVDTDSCKYLGEVDWTAYNRKRIKDSAQSGAWATDSKGKRHYMGVYEQEDGYKEFKTLGAKKYAYIHEGSDQVETTIAGVSKKLGGRELQAAGGLEAFAEGFIFSLAGGTASFYNDNTPIQTVMRDGHRVEMGPNICISPSTYRVGITDEYREILHEISCYRGLTGPGGVLYN